MLDSRPYVARKARKCSMGETHHTCSTRSLLRPCAMIYGPDQRCGIMHAVAPD
jgi:hypothetical protein